MPDSSRYQHAKKIFLTVVDLPLEEREARLQAECGEDSELLQDVRELLTYQSTGGLARPSGPQTAERFPPGTMIGERYRVVSLLGRGAMGEVYRADDLVLGAAVALKFLSPGLAQSSWLDRLRQEVRLARQVTHPNVCRVHDLQETAGHVFISMEYVDGENLAALGKRIGRLPHDKAVDLMWQLLQGLHAAHSRGVLHRDLKPANIMLDGSGQARITDFGIAVTAGEGEPDQARAGTPAYMAPELMRGAPATKRSDLYALGLVFYELLTGHPPRLKFERSDGEPIAVVGDALFEGISSLDPRVEGMVTACLQQDPEQRPVSAAAALQMLAPQGAIGIDLPITLSPDRIAQLASSESPSRRSGFVLAGVFLGLLLMVAIASTQGLQKQGLALEKSPEVLAETAREVVRAFGYEEEFQDESFGFSEYLTDLGNDPGLNFWYRTSPDYLIPVDVENLLFGSRRVTYYDPPALTVPGMVSVILDSRGRLVHFHYVPEPESEAAAVAVATETVLKTAGLEGAALVEIPPQLNPEVYADRRQAWEVALPQGDPWLLDVAWLHGRPVFFELSQAPADSDSMEECPDCEESSLGILENSSQFGVLLDILLIGFSLPLAIRNLRKSRGDLRGAFRMACFVFAARQIVWLLRTSHILDVEAESLLFIVNLSLALGEAAQIWLLYVALEPYLRRSAPLTLVGWSRLLNGRFKDARVIRDVLWGVVAGGFFAAQAQADYLISRAVDPESTFPYLDEWFFDTLLGSRRSLATAGDIALQATYESLVLLFLLALLRIILRDQRLCLFVFMLLICPLFLLEGAHPRLSILLLALPVAAGMTWLLARRGLLAVMVAQFTRYCLTIFPITLDSRSWFFELSISLMVLSVLFVAGLLIVSEWSIREDQLEPLSRSG